MKQVLAKRKKLLASVLGVAFIAGALAAGIYHVSTGDPTPIQVDPRIYDDYAGYYDFRNNYILTIRRDGDRLMSSVPEQLPRQLFPETPTTFFVKGEPGRITFQRDTNGHV